VNESIQEAAKRIAKLPTFDEQRIAANEYNKRHVVTDIYEFYRAINEAIDARWRKAIRRSNRW
jgi:hypothetical protein